LAVILAERLIPLGGGGLMGQYRYSQMGITVGRGAMPVREQREEEPWE
jgi:hypothetical protein